MRASLERRLRQGPGLPTACGRNRRADLEHRPRRARGEFGADRIARRDDRIPRVARNAGAIELRRESVRAASARW